MTNVTPLPQAADLIGFPSRPEDRLRLALRRLDAALLEQQAAVNEYRIDVGRLGAAVAGLEAGLGEYRSALAGAAAETARASLSARRLEATADRAMRGGQTSD